VRNDCSFAEKQEFHPARLLVVHCGRLGSADRDARFRRVAALLPAASSRDLVLRSLALAELELEAAAARGHVHDTDDAALRRAAVAPAMRS
jgi:hypothetical protein